MRTPAHSQDMPAALRSSLDEILRQIVAVAKPEAVMLFGSHAEGVAREDSDFDLLVIADTDDPGLLTEALCAAMADLSQGRWREVPAVDLLVLTPEQWTHESQLPGQLAHRIRRRGVTLHGRAA